MKQRVLITGASGMLGIDLCQELHRDYEVISCDVIPAKASGPAARQAGILQSVIARRPKADEAISQFFRCDVTKKIEVSNVLSKIKPDIIIHTAAMTDVDGCELNPKKAYRINSEGTKNVALACKATGATLIYISTDFVFNGKKKAPYKETDKTKPLGIYADSKLKGEKTVKRALKKYFILRTSWLYGKHGKNFVDTIIAKSKTEKILKVVDDQVGSPTYTKDLVKSIHALINVIASPPRRPKAGGRGEAISHIGYGTYHVSNSGAVSWFDYAKEILKLAKSQTGVTPISSKELNRPAKRPAMSVLDNSKFTEFTGFKMRNWQEALKDYV